MMKHSSGFSKYAVAFAGESVNNLNEIEGPEQLVQFIVQNKKVNKTSKKQKVTQSKITPKEKSQHHFHGRYPNKEGEHDIKSEVNTIHFDETYEHKKNSRPVRNRGQKNGGRNDRGPRLNADGGISSKRQFDRHSGMTNSSVKPASRIHGRDDNNWKEEIVASVDVQIDDEGHIETLAPNDKETKTNTRDFNNRTGGARRGRGRQDFQSNFKHDDKKQRQRNGRGGYNNNSQSQNKSKSVETSKNFVFDDNDFPAFE